MNSQFNSMDTWMRCAGVCSRSETRTNCNKSRCGGSIGSLVLHFHNALWEYHIWLTRFSALSFHPRVRNGVSGMNRFVE